jgi:hypothetical protein
MVLEANRQASLRHPSSTGHRRGHVPSGRVAALIEAAGASLPTFRPIALTPIEKPFLAQSLL